MKKHLKHFKNKYLNHIEIPDDQDTLKNRIGIIKEDDTRSMFNHGIKSKKAMFFSVLSLTTTMILVLGLSIVLFNVTIIPIIDPNIPNEETPIVSIHINDIGFHEVSLDISILNEPLYGYIFSIVLYSENHLIKVFNQNVTQITDLLSNKAYLLVVTYIYCLEDGFPEQSIIKERTFETLKKEEPHLTITSGVYTGQTLYVKFLLDDLHDSAHILKIELYKDGILISELNDVSLTQDSNHDHLYVGEASFLLNESGVYQVVVSYAYDLNDGLGLRYVDRLSLLTYHIFTYILP